MSRQRPDVESMSESASSRDIRIEESAVGSAIVNGDGNTIYVIQQTTDLKREQTTPKQASGIGPNPYKGLAAFKETDAARYFGREAQIERLWQRFQSLYAQSEVPCFLPILGPSGCGKSSLARAGFIPELARRPLPGKERMRVAVLVPGTRPLEALAGVLAKAVTKDPSPVEKAAEFERVLKKSNEASEYEGLRRIANLIPDIRDTPLVILVDQFEEVYSLCKDTKQRQAFIDNLLHAASEPTGEVSVAITLRSDFLSETQRHKQLNQIIGSDQSVIVPAMTTAELRRAIVEPAKQAGYPLDEATTDLLVKDVEDREGALPLLQFALSQIWNGLLEGKTPATTYREMGGVGGALAGKAQETYNRLSELEQKIARRVFVGLVQLGEGSRDTRRRVIVEGLIARQDEPARVKQVIRQFSSSSARLISLSSAEGNEIAEVTHEALFEHWQQLDDWLDSSRDDIRFQRRLETVAQYWEKQGKAEGLLWRPPDLDLLRAYQQRASEDMTAVETSFWQASERAEQHRKRTRQLVTSGLALGLLFTSLSSGIAFWNVRKANRNSVKALAQSAATLNASGDAFGAFVMALRAKQQHSDNRLRDSVMLNQITGEFYTSLFQNARELSRFDGHSATVGNVRFSPDGKTLATASYDGTAKLWQLDGSLITTLEGHGDSVVNMHFSPDGKTLATASYDGTAKLWQLDGSLVTTLEGHDNVVGDVRFSPNGKTLATASYDGTAKLWQLDGSLVTTLEGHSNAVRDVRFSPDGKTLATASDDGTAKLWQLDGSLITTLEGHSNAVRDVRFSPDGKTLATASDDATAKLWQLDGNLITTLEGHGDQVLNVGFSLDGQTVATGSNDGTAKLWQLDGSLTTTLEGHGGGVGNVRFSPNGNALVTSGSRTAKLWQLNGSLITTLEGHSAGFIDVRFSPDGKTVATGNADRTAKLWQLDDSLVTTLEGHDGWVRNVRFSPNGKAVATAGYDGTAKLWQLDGVLISTLEGHGDSVGDMRFSPNGKILATASGDETAKLWQLDGSLITTLEGHGEWVSDVRFSPDGKTVATASSDGTAKLWQLDGSLITTLEGHSYEVRNVRFSPDGKTVATASNDGTAKLWQLDGSLISTLEGHDGWVGDVRFSPDGKTLATASGDKTVKLWQIDGSLISTLEGHGEWVSDVRFSPDGKTLATASGDKTAKLWQLDGSLITTLEGHGQWVNDVRFSPDGKTLATASDDGTAKLWQLDGSLITTLEGHGGWVGDVRFSPNGKILATASHNGTAKLWPLDLDVLVAHTCQNMQGYLLSSPNVQPEDKDLCD